MAKDDHWFKFYYRLIVLSTQGWKDDEFGAYVRLLIHQFDKGGLPDDPGELSKLISSFKKNWPALSKKFNKDEDGLLRNDFMKGIRDERDKKSIIGAEYGKTGGRGNKKGTLSENKGNPLKNERESLSPSSSISSSTLEEGGTEEETAESIVHFDAEKLILENQIRFETICMSVPKDFGIDRIKEALRKYHLYCNEKKSYPLTKKQIYSGFERWLMNEKNFSNGNSAGKKNNSSKPVITGSATGAGTF